jgi:ATP-dependent protease ClpP protease subunit
LNKTVYRKTSIQLGKDENYLKEQISKHNHVDWYLNSKEAKRHGIANQIRVPNFNLNIKV